ncbi:kelch domain-containing protein 8A-like [Carassius auratus]|uniref:Kelch domain-containing protein 8A-like n=1 Tax=Carassius auratus TaxID=7957 RepID=A0A6P6KZF3_CARAU|nr:kelch domain-containing protein 8A-like [Carassius auratus]
MTVPSAHEFHWQSLACLSSGRVYHSLADVGGQLYMVGGCDASGRPTSALDLYSPEVDRWLSLPPMPTPRAGAAVAVLGKQLLVVGGMGKDQRPLKAVEVYNTEEGKWRKRCSLREASMGLSVTVKDGRALAVGGMGADLLPRSVLQQYDLRKDMWALLPPMPTPRYHTSICLLGSKIYVAGGRQCKRLVKAFEVFDMESRTWSSLPSLPCKRSYSGVLWDSAGHLCWLGGLRQGGLHQSSKFTKNVNIFDTNQGTWLKSEDTVPLKTKRADFATAIVRGRMIVAGGLGHQPSVLDTVEAFHPEKRKWEMLSPMASPRCSATSIVIRDRLLVVGGVNQVPSSAHEILYVKEEEIL